MNALKQAVFIKLDGVPQLTAKLTAKPTIDSNQ
jgi:hypothetical protein